MSRAEKFIQDYTRNCSNLLYRDYIGGFDKTIYQPWLTPDQALRAVEIAREEVMQQLMKDAVALETEIFLEGGTTLQFKKGEIFLPDNNPKTSKFKAGDKVKLIIIKED